MLVQGKKALITGGARGIGKEIVVAFLNEGASVYFIDLNPSEYMDEYEKLPGRRARKSLITRGTSRRKMKFQV